MEEQEINIIMNKNWNRMSELSKMKKKNELLQIEMDYRVAVQNKMANNLDKKEQEKTIKELLDFNEKVKKRFHSKWL